MDKLNQLPGSYEEFLLHNRKYINGSFLYVILTCILTGPAIALGIYFGVFKNTNYRCCVVISLVMIILYFVILYLYKRSPYSKYSAHLAICVMDIMLVYMTYEKINVRITWFLMPLLSMLLLDLKVYLFTCFYNYLMMLVSIWITAPYIASIEEEYSTANEYFINNLMGISIEMVIMCVVGYEIGRLIAYYYKSLIDEKLTLSNAEREMEKQDIMLESMTDLYDKVNYIDFDAMLEQSLQGNQKIEYELNITEDSHSHMVNSMIQNVPKDELDRFLEFTDLKTIQKRLSKQKIVSEEFIKDDNRWYRLQYICVATDENGLPQKIIFTTRNIDEEKKREDYLLAIALTDGLTNLRNRRCYDKDIAEMKKNPVPSDICVMSLDVNGLKVINDTFGHDAGDELIIGAAKCILDSMEREGKLYRTGGDEFIAIIFTKDYKKIVETILKNAEQWRGKNNNSLALSIGVASILDYPDATIEELEKKSDDIMYRNKEAYYKENGIDRSALYYKYKAK